MVLQPQDFFNQPGGIAVITFGVLAIVFALSLFPIIFYYFTGAKKHGESFMPRISRIALRINNFVWTYIGMIFAFLGVYAILFYIVEKLWPGENSSQFFDEIDSGARGYLEDVELMVEFETIVRGLVTLLVGLLIILFFSFANTKVGKTKDEAVLLSKRIFLTFTLVTFSIITILSFIAASDNILNTIYDDHSFVYAGYIASFLGGLVFLILVMWNFMKSISEDDV